jgi:flagellar motor switch protein FliN/FliY
MTAASLNRELYAALVEELGIVISAMIDSPASVNPGAPAMGKQWIAQVAVKGPLTGGLTVVFDHEGAVAMTRVMTGIDGDMPDEAVVDTLREVTAQAVGALVLKPVAKSAAMNVASVVAAEDRVPEGEWTAYGVAAEKLPAPLSVTTWGGVSVADTAGPVAVAKPAPAAVAAPVSNERALEDRIDVLLDIDLPLVVRFGRTEMPLKALTRLGPGSVIDLGRSPDDPVEVLVSNRVVARGEVVVVSGSYGIRILDVVSQRERVRSVEA